MTDYARTLDKAMVEISIAKELGPRAGHAVLVQARYHLNLAMEDAAHQEKRENRVCPAVADHIVDANNMETVTAATVSR